MKSRSIRLCALCARESWMYELLESCPGRALGMLQEEKDAAPFVNSCCELHADRVQAVLQILVYHGSPPLPASFLGKMSWDGFWSGECVAVQSGSLTVRESNHGLTAPDDYFYVPLLFHVLQSSCLCFI